MFYFTLQSGAIGIPSGVPAKFTKSLRQREKSIDQWQKTVKSAGLTKEQKKQFQDLVETRFQVNIIPWIHLLCLFYILYNVQNAHVFWPKIWI